ncbi:MAG: hypothetical protein OEZ01_11020 [Candidatus Heimdallarchaeota archaeon]|nr:hypothetical protein [Candidatus Heimdallarchaeota archaeon]MDH5646533.1 hypothetical protein [Candidatus Heimdallarchaeota archaeon]
MSTTKNEGSKFTNFLDNIWGQFLLATVITVGWFVWTLWEIVWKS